MSSAASSRHHAARLDAEDPLRDFRERFVLDEGLVYLDGNSLGALPRATLERLRYVVAREWGERLIRAWDEGWLELPLSVGERLAPLLGAASGRVVLGDSTTVCFYKLASAALELRPDRVEIVTDSDNFPTDRYALEGIARARAKRINWLDSAEDLADVIGEETALVALSHVSYRSAYVADMAAANALVHEAGALVLWDLSHSAGAVPLALDRDGTDLAVGCTYKYLNGGPGAPAFMYVNPGLLQDLRQPVWGWLGRRDPFAMEPGFVPADGIRALLSGTPPILGLAAAEEGIKLVAEAGIGPIRAKGVALGEYAIALVDERLGGRGFSIASPRESERRGAHLALAHEDAARLCSELIERGVLVDFRRPDVIRLGFSPLTTRFVDVWDAVEALASVERPGVHRLV